MGSESKEFNYALDAEALNWLSQVAESSKKTHKETIEKYELWREYLKCSETYEEVCKWFKQIRSFPKESEEEINKALAADDFSIFMDSYLTLKSIVPPVSLETYFNTTLKDIKRDRIRKILTDAFFIWAFDAGFPFEDEMLMNYFVFGNIYHDSEPFKTSRLAIILEMQNATSISEIHETLELLFYGAERMAREALGREPTVKEFQDLLKPLIKNDYRLHISINNPYENKEMLLDKVSHIIQKKRAENPELAESYKRKPPYWSAGRFECPGGNVRMDELKRYLKTYDLRRNGKSNSEIAGIVYPNYDPTEKSTIRMVMRDRQKAEKIVANVERGFFPGSYQ